MELNEILAAIKALSEEERATALAALEQTEAPQEPAEGEPSTQDNGETEPSAVPVAEEPEPEGEEPSAPEPGAEGADAAQQEPSPIVNEEEAPALPAEEPIPEMAKGGDPAPDPKAELPAQEAPMLADEQGGEMPADYQQIIDGQNAKIMALEAENRQLKSKVEGAFGLSGKPGNFAPVNSLYGDTTDIPQMRK